MQLNHKKTNEARWVPQTFFFFLLPRQSGASESPGSQLEMSQPWLECLVVLRTHNTVFTHMHPNKAEQINNEKDQQCSWIIPQPNGTTKEEEKKNEEVERICVHFPPGPMRTMHSGHAHSFVITRCMLESEVFGRQSQFYNFLRANHEPFIWEENVP